MAVKKAVKRKAVKKAAPKKRKVAKKSAAKKAVKKAAPKRKAAKKAKPAAKKAKPAAKKRKPAAKKAKKRVAKKRSVRKYSPLAGKEVAEEIARFKKGTAKSGKAELPVESREQAIAIGLSKARKKGEKVPKKP